jgi:endonuclease/exonuclease/phosphatase (EEP) superfamily protein YafD
MQFIARKWRNSSSNSWASYCLFAGIIVITLLSIIGSFGWKDLLELLSHFKLQYFFLNLLLFGLLFLTHQRTLILISVFCLAINVVEIAPWYIPQSGLGGNTSTQLRVLSSNVNVQNQSYSKVLSLVRKEKPDIAIFMEIDENWVNQLNFLKDILPYSVVKANRYNLGIAVYSKRNLEDGSFAFFGGTNNPSIVGTLNINGENLSLIATHPPPPKPGALFHVRNRQLDEIGQYIKSLSTKVVIAGDFNITMWSPYYKRLVSKTGLKNSRQGFGLLPTWPIKTNYPPYAKIPSFLTGLLSIPIDHCLISPDIKVAKIRTGPNVGSDHRPLIVDLVIPANRDSKRQEVKD